MLKAMRTWQLRNGSLQIPSEGGIMGILNVTPDSFSDGGLYLTGEAALKQAERLIAEGSLILDIGGESTRPGAEEIDEQTEANRTIPIIRALRDRFPHQLLSIDTRHPSVAEQALDAGADIINDITGLASAQMRALCAARPCGIILMHMQGEPRTMQQAPHYDNVVAEVRDFFSQRIALAQAEGICPSRICLDPGIGFGKTVKHNLLLIKHLEKTRVQNLPILMALSRKRFMGSILNDEHLPKQTPLPTVTMSLLASDTGADLHRVHDVAPLHQALILRKALHTA